jgi:HSP20 family protein
MTLMRYRTFNPTGALQGDLKQAFNQFLASVDENDQSSVETAQWTPRVDIKEEATRFVIRADIPGVEPRDIEIQMEKGVLSIKGERAEDAKQEGEKFTRVERSRGLFHRRFALPDSADADAITASGKHGVLEIVIPKKAETTPRRIAINA